MSSDKINSLLREKYELEVLKTALQQEINRMELGSRLHLIDGKQDPALDIRNMSLHDRLRKCELEIEKISLTISCERKNDNYQKRLEQLDYDKNIGYKNSVSFSNIDLLKLLDKLTDWVPLESIRKKQHKLIADELCEVIKYQNQGRYMLARWRVFWCIAFWLKYLVSDYISSILPKWRS